MSCPWHAIHNLLGLKSKGNKMFYCPPRFFHVLICPIKLPGVKSDWMRLIYVDLCHQFFFLEIFRHFPSCYVAMVWTSYLTSKDWRKAVLVAFTSYGNKYLLVSFQYNLTMMWYYATIYSANASWPWINIFAFTFWWSHLPLWFESNGVCISPDQNRKCMF